MAENGKEPRGLGPPRRGLDPDFLETVLAFARAVNEKQSAEPPAPSKDGPGARLEKWRELTDA
jgi:hypothetical protein